MTQRNSLRLQLSAVFLFFLLLVVVLGLFSIGQLSDVNRESEDIRDRWLQSTRILGDLNNYTSDYRAAEASHLLASSPEMIASTEREIVELDSLISQAQQSYEKIPHGESEGAIYRRFASAWKEYKVIAERVFELSRVHRKIEGSTLYMTGSRAAYDAASDTLGKLTSHTVARASEASGRAAATYEYSRKLIIGAMLLAVVSVIGVLQYITGSVSKPLLELAEKMRSLASKNMDIDIEGTRRRDEIGEMARAVVVFRNNAVELVHSQAGLIQQASMLEERLGEEQRLMTLQRNFVSMASHEFRTPLTIIDGHAQRLIKMREALQPDDIVERAEKVRNAVLRMTSIMDNLLTSSRLFEGDASLYFHPTRTEVKTLLHAVCHLHREISTGTLILENFYRLPPATAIMADRNLLFQVFSNLLSNAVKYSPKDGHVEVKAVVEADQLVVTTRDNGIGIPEQDRDRLFERYFRGSNVTGFVGTGIGLYLVKMVVSLHGGQVSVTSEEGRGSEFTVRLPINRGGLVAPAAGITPR